MGHIKPKSFKEIREMSPSILACLYMNCFEANLRDPNEDDLNQLNYATEELSIRPAKERIFFATEIHRCLDRAISRENYELAVILRENIKHYDIHIS